MKSPTYNLYKLNCSSNSGFQPSISDLPYVCLSVIRDPQFVNFWDQRLIGRSLGPFGWWDFYWGEVGGLILSGSSPEPGSPFVLFSFFHFIRLFWNHILICLSVRHNAWAISIRLLRVRYRLKWNSFSNSKVWYRVYVCRPRFRSEMR